MAITNQLSTNPKYQALMAAARFALEQDEDDADDHAVRSKILGLRRSVWHSTPAEVAPTYTERGFVHASSLN